MTDERWHLDRRVSVGHIVTTILVAVSAAVWMMRLESHILAQSARIDWIEQAVKEDQVEIKSTLRRIWDTLRRVEEKVARKVDKD
jgi:hypothetical protein